MATLGMDPNISQGISQLGGAMLKLPSIRAGAMADAQKQANADRTYQLGLDRNNAQIPLYGAQANYYNARAAAEQNKSLAASLFPGALEGAMEYTPAVEAQAATEATDGISPGFQGPDPGFSAADQPMSSIAAYPGVPATPAMPAVAASPARTSISKNPQMLARVVALGLQSGYNPEQVSGALRELIGTGMMTTPGQELEGMNVTTPGSADLNSVVNMEDRNAMIANNAANAQALARVRGELANAGSYANTELRNKGAMERLQLKNENLNTNKEGKPPTLTFSQERDSELLGFQIMDEFLTLNGEPGNDGMNKKISEHYLSTPRGIEVQSNLNKVVKNAYAKTKNVAEAEEAGINYLRSLKNEQLYEDKALWEGVTGKTKYYIANKEIVENEAPTVSPTGSGAAPSEKKTDTPADAIAPTATTATGNLSTDAYARALRITPQEFDKRVKDSGMTPSDYYKSVKDLAPTSSSANVTNTSAANGVNPISPEKTNYVQLPGNNNATEDYASPVESSTAQEGSFGSLLSSDSQVEENTPAAAVASVPGKYSVQSGTGTPENIQPKAIEEGKNTAGDKYKIGNVDGIIGKSESPASAIAQPDTGYNAEEASYSIFTQPEDNMNFNIEKTYEHFKGTGTVEETLPQKAGSPSGSNVASTEKTPFEKSYISLIEEKRKLSKSLMKDESYGSDLIGQNKDGTMYDRVTRKTIGSQDAVTKRLIEIDKKLNELTSSPFARISPSAAMLDKLTVDGAGKYYIADASTIPDATKRPLFIDKKELMFLLQNPTITRNSDGSPRAHYKTDSGKYLQEEDVFRDFDKYHEKLANYFIQEGLFDMKPGDSLARKLFQLKVAADKEILQYNKVRGEKSWLKQQGEMGGLPGLNITVGNGASRSSMRTGSNEYLKQHPIPEVP